jgi:putative membrane protein insertion efficiency factor
MGTYRKIILPFVWILKGYQMMVSPILCLLGVQCRYVPSCSEYAIEAVEKYGIIKGGFLMVRRLLCCHPGCLGGSDPVP